MWPLSDFEALDAGYQERSQPIEDEHHAIFDCSGYADVQEHYRDLFQSHITTNGAFLKQPQCNALAKFLILTRMRMNIDH